MRTTAVVTSAILGALWACTPYDPALGDSPFYCGSADPKCPDGYTCMPAATGSAVCATTMHPGSGSGSGTCAAFSGVLATWDLASEPGSQSSTPATTTATGVTASPIARATSLMASPGTGSISASMWPTTAQRDPAAYFTISVTPRSGCSLGVSSVAVDVKSSTTGPAMASLATSANGFADEQPVSTTMASTVAVSVAGQTATVELRIYGFAASATTGTMRVQNQLSVTGSLQ